jgi:hypothetical protein
MLQSSGCMEHTMTTAVFLKTRSDYKAAIEQYMAEMQRLHDQMARDQEDINRLRVEARHSWPSCRLPEPQPCSSSFMFLPGYW